MGICSVGAFSEELAVRWNPRPVGPCRRTSGFTVTVSSLGELHVQLAPLLAFLLIHRSGKGHICICISPDGLGSLCLFPGMKLLLTSSEVSLIT